MISYQYLSLAMGKSLANKNFPTNTGKNELEQNEKIYLMKIHFLCFRIPCLKTIVPGYIFLSLSHEI